MKIWLLRAGAVGIAGFFGAIARFGIGQLIGRLGNFFPLGTLVINLTGSFILGWFFTYATARNFSETYRLAIATGFVGAYTTFSTYMYESNDLIHEGAGILATVNIVGSVLLGILAVRLGIHLAGGYPK